VPLDVIGIVPDGQRRSFSYYGRGSSSGSSASAGSSKGTAAGTGTSVGGTRIEINVNNKETTKAPSLTKTSGDTLVKIVPSSSDGASVRSPVLSANAAATKS
jgi:hypothetical protein